MKKERIPFLDRQVHFRVSTEENHVWREGARRLQLQLSEMIRLAVQDYLDRHWEELQEGADGD